jgi:hypothetical protein
MALPLNLYPRYEHPTLEQLVEGTVEWFISFKHSPEEIYVWACREHGLNAKKAEMTMLLLKEKHRDLFDAVMAVYNAKVAEAKASAPAPAAPAATVLKNPGEVKPRVFPVAPATTYEQAQKYGATPYTCGCPDRAARNGSYVGLDGRKACKHMIFHQKYYTDIAI